MDAELSTPQSVALDRIAHILDAIPGPDGTGVGAPDRAAIFAFLYDPTRARWREIVNVTVTRRHKLRVAVMSHCEIGMYVLPSPAQVLSACVAAAAGALRP